MVSNDQMMTVLPFLLLLFANTFKKQKNCLLTDRIYKTENIKLKTFSNMLDVLGCKRKQVLGYLSEHRKFRLTSGHALHAYSTVALLSSSVSPFMVHFADYDTAPHV